MLKRKTKYARGKSKRNIRKTNRNSKRRMKTRRRRGGLVPSLLVKVKMVMDKDKKEGLIDEEMYNYIQNKKLIPSIINHFGESMLQYRPSDIAIEVYINAMIERVKDLAEKDLMDRNIKQSCFDCIVSKKLIEQEVKNLFRRQLKSQVLQERIKHGRVLHDIPYAKKMFISETPSDIFRIVLIETTRDECDACD